jgi:hypothetical protein
MINDGFITNIILILIAMFLNFYECLQNSLVALGFTLPGMKYLWEVEPVWKERKF